MRTQRVREAESRVEMQAAKWTAEGAVKGKSRVFCDVEAYVSCRRYDSILQSAWATVNQGGTAGIECIPAPDRIILFCQGRVFSRKH